MVHSSELIKSDGSRSVSVISVEESSQVLLLISAESRDPGRVPGSISDCWRGGVGGGWNSRSVGWSTVGGSSGVGSGWSSGVGGGWKG